MTAGPDPVRRAVLAQRLGLITTRMANALYRTGRSTVISGAQDFSCALVTADHENLVGADSLPIHAMSGPDLIARAVADAHPRMRPGDAFLHNSPYHGGGHAADQCVVVPVFDDSGRHRFTSVAKAHQADIGNSQPTTYMATATDVYEEGALIFPAVQIQRDGEHIDDIVRMCRMRIRVPDQWWGDYLAALGAARTGERGLVELARSVGWDTLDAHVADWFDYSEARMADALRALTGGEATATSTHDPFAGTPDGLRITATVRIDSDTGRAEVDLRDNPDNVASGLNLTESTARTAAMIGVFNSVPPTVPRNAGSFRRITVRLREGCVAGIPAHPASCSVATTNVADRVVNAVHLAVASIGEGMGMAEAGAIAPPAMAVLSGVDARSGRRFVNQIHLATTGGPAGPDGDGWLTLCHIGNGGVMHVDSVEIIEDQYPIRVHRQELLPDTEGAGRHRGAPSAIVAYSPVSGPVDVMFRSDGGVNPARGARGGGRGRGSEQFLATGDDPPAPMDPWSRARVAPGQTVVSISSGGGGYGPPHQRDPRLVAGDVAEGLVSPERARRTYGVAFDDTGAVDWDRTARLRQSRREAG